MGDLRGRGVRLIMLGPRVNSGVLISRHNKTFQKQVTKLDDPADEPT